MSSFSNISIVGNLTRDPEMYVFEKSGRKKTTMTVAVNNWSKNKNDQVEKTADFYKVETWDRLADLTKDYLKKGSQVAVSGRLQMETWKDNSGKERVTPLVKASQIALPQKSSTKPPETASNAKNEDVSKNEIRAVVVKGDEEFDISEMPPELLVQDEVPSRTDSTDDDDAEISGDADLEDVESDAQGETPQPTQFGQTMKIVDPTANVVETTTINPPTIESIARTA